MRTRLHRAVSATVVVVACACGGTGAGQDNLTENLTNDASRKHTATPIKHLVVIYGENVSFDHYFGTYPVAANVDGEPEFVGAAGTPSVNGLSGALLTANPNASNTANGAGATNPFRLDRAQASTADQDHAYTAEQHAYDNGAADLFPAFTGKAGTGGTGAFDTTGLVMGYYDGNTVTALWNYAQAFAMSDNAYSDQYGPSTPGAVNLISGQTNGLTLAASSYSAYYINDGQGGLALIGDVDPAGDLCSSATDQASLTGRNIGDLLNAAGVTWGWFQGGFDLTATNPNDTTGCKRSSYSQVTAFAEADYIPHHAPFQYYASTANPSHARPSSPRFVGSSYDGANHQYDLEDFFAAVRSGAFPSVTFLKAAGFEDGHAGYSDALDEQAFITRVVNFLEQQPQWSSTAVILAYDDSDGWYDHQMAPVGNASFDTTVDQLNGSGACGTPGSTPQAGGVSSSQPVNGRCGPGTRQPFLVVSPWAQRNYVDHTLITQSSVARFIEDNWLNGQRIGQGSFDATTGAIDGLFDFSGTGARRYSFWTPTSEHRLRRPA
jgi:phospholipase C